MKTLAKIMLGAASTMMFALPAQAGKVQPAPVTVDLDTRFAGGDLITARDDKDDEVFIGCGMRAFDFGGGATFTTGFCQATDDEGDAVLCFTQSDHLLESMRSTSDSAYLTFSWDDDGSGNLTCNRVGFSTQSFYLDKHTMGNTQGNGK